MQDYQFSKISIIGCGPVAMLAALTLKKQGLEPLLIGPEAQSEDLRTTALMMPAINFLKKLDLWQSLKPYAAPLSKMRLVDGTNALLRSPTLCFCAQEIGQAVFGYNIENKFLNKILKDKVDSIKHIEAKLVGLENANPIVCHLDNGQKIQSEIILAADGRNSTARNLLRIDTKKIVFQQVAIITKFSHELPHNNCSTEIHSATGPFTQVPLPGDNSSLIWSVSRPEADEILNLPIKKLNELIAAKLNYILGKIELTAPLQHYNLSSAIATSFAKNNILLLGEAAHSFPPIGAQGLNLSIRDVQAIDELLKQNIANIGEAYNNARKADVNTRALIINSLNKSLIKGNIFWHLPRFASFKLLEHSKMLRTLFMREGMAPSEFFLNITGRLF